MQPRRPIALVAAALLLCVPVLSSCGFNKEVEKPYTPGAGTNYREGTVFVLGAVIAAAQPDSGTLIASFTNQSTSKTETLESVAGASGNTVQAGEFSPISLKPMGFDNLAETGGITLSGSFAAGDIIPLSLNFEDGATVTMDVPVVYACQEYAGLDVSQASSSAAPAVSATGVATPLAGGSASTSATGSTGATAAPPTVAIQSSGSATPAGQATPSPSDTTEPSDAGSPTAYTCGTSGGTGGKN